MATKTVKHGEENFQEVANQYAHGRIESMREDLDNEAERENIMDQALEVSVREGWHQPGQTDKPCGYYILLGTGGPASRIIGELSEHGYPTSARFEYQDWFKPWTEADNLSIEEQGTLLEYANCFWFGE